MKIIKFVEENVSLVLLIGIPLGLIFPFFGSLKWSLKYILMFVLFVSFLKIDFDELILFIKRPFVPVYATLANLLLVPVAMFFLLKFFGTENDLLAAILLLSAVPSGVASAAMTELSEGDSALTLVITIFSHFLAPISIPVLFYLLMGKAVKLNYTGVSMTMAELILVPFLLAFIFRKFF
ncbi:MAG: bile acid:sodium symporter, partial [Caldisericaceae bacterium]|nr:bile acid:sodium symporter [Caldisericaceae bacterium]